MCDFAKILQAMNDPLVSIDDRFIIDYANPALERLLEFDQGELTGMPLARIIGDDYLLAHIKNELTGGREMSGFSGYLTSKDNQQVEIIITGSNILDEQGKRAASVLTATKSHHCLDLDEALQKKQAELIRSNKSLDQFAYVVSHDLKAPLRAISILVQCLEEDLDDKLDDDDRENMMLLKNRAKRMDSMIKGVLEYSRVGREGRDKVTVNVANLLKKVINDMPKGDFIIHVEDDMPTIETDKLGLSQIFSNLISNAIKYGDKSNGRLDISTKKLDNHYEFRFSDNGSGIDPAYHDKIFNIFQTLNSRDKVESTGIGLSLVKKIVEEHRGEVWLESKVGEGSCFIFTWPL